ncbi:hypothetical protein TNCV_4197341 [Trichonephila clavipes]|nr:hypothetical protein TNCV_4197341 [Trichonephila clavipes]
MTSARGHCLLFELGQSLTPSLAIIIVKREPAPIDNRRSLYKMNPVASAGVERMGRGEESPGGRELGRGALDGEKLRRALKKETWSEIGVERKERR